VASVEWRAILTVAGYIEGNWREVTAPYKSETFELYKGMKFI
jgi:hypothetical protein